ncbi:hypothetical protein [Salinisphaera aquimarina]|uniref:Uncharacterized protein n=1 Tax=Salinisphaera aquimarina TaxID=2094031 RepID=A0ABV7ER96_9GAMM
MGLFDLPAPLFTFIDNVMASVLPATLRLVVWAVVGAVGTMLLYKVLSPQARIGRAKKDAKAARRRLNEFDGDFADAGPLIRDQFVSAFRQLGLVVPGTIIAILPLLCLLVWAETWYGANLPEPGQAPTITTQPTGFDTSWDDAQQPTHLRVGRDGNNIADIVMRAPVGIVTKKPWWHWLAANPIGYLPDNAPLQQVRIELPEPHYLPFGPGWMRSWLAIFIPIMFVISLILYKWLRIE